jgi:SH3 domain-containing protein
LERDSPLYSEPRLDASQVTQLKQGATGDVVGKQGGWLNLKTPGGTGWLFSFNVRFPAQKTEGGNAGASPALGRMFGPQRNVTSSIGIRGLDEEDLRQASFNAGQMKLLDDYATSKQAAEERSRAEGLAPASVEYLDAKK